MRVGIIGAGASGLFLASYLSRYSDYDITIFERNKKIGSKIKASGNGKCNFSNYKALPSDYNNESFIEELFRNTKKEELFNYLSEIGFMFKFDEEGRMYPITNSSESFLNLLTAEFKNVKILLDSPVSKIDKKNSKYIVNGLEFDKVVLATGSNASIAKDKWNFTYDYLRSLDLKMVDTKPSLVGFKVKENVKDLSGFRSKASVSLFENDKLIFKEFGEVIFKDDGISGIVVMNASHYYNNKKEFLSLNLLPGVEVNELKYKLKKRYDYKQNIEYALTGLLHPSLIKYFIKNRINDIDTIISTLTNFKLNIVDTYSLEFAQVSKGGVDVSEIDSSFRLKKDNNIYILGEMLDINGVCGGYNLMFAFLSALTASKELLK